MFPLTSFYAVNWNGHSIPRDGFTSDRQLPVQIIPELNEMFFGDWEMRHHRDLMQEDAENYSAWCNDWQHAIPTNGEGFQAFSQRVERFIARLSEYQHYQNIF